MSAAETKAPAPTKQGVSPMADAWRRLKKNKMAMGGVWVVTAISLLAVLAPAIAPFDATYEFAWIGSQPPGYTHPHAKAKNALAVGADPELPEDYATASTFSYRVRETSRTEYLIRSTRSAPYDVREIKDLTGGAITLDALPAASEGTYYEIDAGPLQGTSLEGFGLAVGDPAPAALGVGESTRGWVVKLVHIAPVGEFTVAAEVAGGAVTSLTQNDEPVEAIEFDGRHVLKVTADGAEQQATHWLGTDNKGRDVLSRTLWGARISLLVGLVATIVSLVIGVVYGAISGYAGGTVDMVLMAIVDILYGIPYLFLVILLMVTFGRDIVILFIALGAVQWLTMARIVRGQVLSLKQKEFVEAAIMAGSGPAKILFSHLIPNTLGVVVVYTTLTVPAVILQESFLAFIGLSVEYGGQPLESWGALINHGRLALGDGGANWWQLVFPSLAMAATLFSLNFLGDGLRDAFDPQQRGRT